jgi:uncharacterized protein YukE
MTITDGADADALDRLAGQIEQGAAHIEGTYGPVRQTFHGSSWQGPDADQFSNEWDGPSKARLTATATALREAAKTLRKNANEQRIASDDMTGLGASLAGTFRRMIGDPFAHRGSGFSGEGSMGSVQPDHESFGKFLWRSVKNAPVVGSLIDLGETTIAEGKALWNVGDAVYDSFQYGIFSDEAAAAWDRASDAQLQADGQALDFASGLFLKTSGIDEALNFSDYLFGSDTEGWLSPSRYTFEALR